MNPGLITYNQIINDSLMPNLSIFGDEKSCRQILIYIDSDVVNNNKRFFLSLIDNMNSAGIRMKDILIEEWNYLAKQPDNYCSDPLFQKMNKIIWPDKLVHLYFKISINCAFSHLLWLENVVQNEEDDRVIGFKTMRSLKDIGQLINDCHESTNEGDSSDNIFEIIRMILAFVWLKILSLYHKNIYMDGLPLTKEEVIYYITYREDSSVKLNIIREAILQELNLQEEKAEKAENVAERNIAAENKPLQMNDIGELAHDLRTEVETIKNVIYKIENKKLLEAEYLKPKDASEFLNISKTTLNSWRKKGIIKDYHFIGNRYEYNKAELTKLKTQKNEKK